MRYLGCLAADRDGAVECVRICAWTAAAGRGA